MTYIVEPNVKVNFDALARNSAEFIDSQKHLSAILQTPAYAGIFIKKEKIPQEIDEKIHARPQNTFATLLSQFYTHNPAYSFQLFGNNTQKMLIEHDPKRESFIAAHQARLQDDNSFEYKTREIDFLAEKLRIIALHKRDIATLTALDCFQHQAKDVETSAHALGEALVLAQPMIYAA
jgi:hypothetical protein